MEDILTELHTRGVSFVTIGKTCGGVNLLSAAPMVYRDILHGEIRKYLDLSPRCQLHQQPCRVCGSRATLYDKGGIKNLKVMEEGSTAFRHDQQWTDLRQLVLLRRSDPSPP